MLSLHRHVSLYGDEDKKIKHRCDKNVNDLLCSYEMSQRKTQIYIFAPIMHHSAGNCQFAFHTFFLAPDTESSTLTMGRAHYDQLISAYFGSIKSIILSILSGTF